MVYQHLSVYFLIFALIHPIYSDIYMQNPRGTNNRHNEKTRDRANAKLNFDSENNNRGGYNVGDGGVMYYYTKSILPIQWTNQHSCNDVNSDCTLILQYACSDSFRDGTGTTQIPLTIDGSKDTQYRLTEGLSTYGHCAIRSRDRNIFIADQKVGNAGINTRQNPNGERYGYECPEERDYYPHWQPNDWIDIAILTNRQDLCSYYRQNSQNVQSRAACTLSKPEDIITAINNKVILPNNKDDCLAYNKTAGIKPQWVVYPSKGLPPPECYSPSYTRENHLGDVKGSEMATFNWTLPDKASKKCVLRIRYNISTADYDGWNINSTYNGNSLPIMPELFANETVALQRDYRFENNPEVKLFDDIDLKLRLAINTAQLSRTFEDRSYIFEVRQRPSNFGDKPVYNLNVRGRRGNIVQNFPAVEYDFVPTRLEVSPDSYVHVQWIGSNTTPDGDGQGKQNTDRNNILMMKNTVINDQWKPYDYLNATGLWNGNLPANLSQSSFLGLPMADLRRLAASGTYTDTQLNAASPYFDLGARSVTKNLTGIYHYVCTRNNDFSNRDQKGRIIVQPYAFQYQLIGQNSFTATLGDAKIEFPEGSVETSVSVKYAKYGKDELNDIVPENGRNIASKEKLYNNIYVIEPHDLQFVRNVEFQIPYSEFDGDADNAQVLRFEPQGGVYIKLPSQLDTDNRLLKFQTDNGGIYVFVDNSSSSATWIIGLVVPVVIVALIVISTIVYFRLNPQRYTKVKKQINDTKRSVFSRV